jgi:hypothetical protein
MSFHQRHPGVSRPPGRYYPPRLTAHPQCSHECLMPRLTAHPPPRCSQKFLMCSAAQHSHLPAMRLRQLVQLHLALFMLQVTTHCSEATSTIMEARMNATAFLFALLTLVELCYLRGQGNYLNDLHKANSTIRIFPSNQDTPSAPSTSTR